MKNFALVLFACVFAVNTTRADDLDLLSDDMLLGAEVETSASDAQSAQNSDDNNAEKSESFLGFIIKPISDFFNYDQPVNTPVEGDKETPLEKSIRKAGEGSLEDQMNLAYMYLYGTNGITQDAQKAFEYYDMAAKQNDPIALNNLGSLYFSGIGTPKSNESALMCFQKASELGNDNASLNLAFIYLTGGTKDSVRNQKALELFEKAQKAGNKIAEFMLGYAYYKGFMVAPDYTKAYKLIKSAANDKSQIDEAQLVLADMYTNGLGTVQNYASAVQAYRSAVNQGNMEAILALAVIYSQGKITPQNPILALALYNVAAAQNVPDAAQKRDKLNSKMPLEALTNAQTIAQNFKTAPSELTAYIRQTYGYNIRHYIDINMPDYKKNK